MTLNDLERRYFTECGKPMCNRVDLCTAEFMQESIVFCSACTVRVIVKKVYVRNLIC